MNPYPTLLGDRFSVPPENWTLLNLPLPPSLMPRSQNYEAEADGHFQFDVSISTPLIGLLVSYRGQLDCLQPGSRTN